MARKPPALARELLRNFPKRRARNARRRRKSAKGGSNGRGPGVETGTAKGVNAGAVRDSGAARAPSNSVLMGALSSEPSVPVSASGLQTGADETLQRSVEEALNHAGE
jgi:hypothetical protein